MSEIYFGRVPRFRPRSKRGIFQLGRVIELIDRARDSKAGRVTWPPNDRQPKIFVRIIAAVVFADVSPTKKRINVVRSRAVPDAGQVFVGQGRVDKRIVPRVMAGHPIADDGRKLSDLKTDPWTIERSVAEKIFVQPDLRALIRRIKATIETGLGKEIKMLCELGVEKERYSRIEKETIVAGNQCRRSLIDKVAFEINQAAQLQLDTILRIADRQRVVHAVEKVGVRFEQKRESDHGAEDVDLTSHELIP